MTADDDVGVVGEVWEYDTDTDENITNKIIIPWPGSGQLE